MSFNSPPGGLNNHYPDEGHGFAKRENQIDAMEQTVEWFDRYLKGKQ